MASPARSEQLAFIQGLRGIAAAAVVLYHARIFIDGPGYLSLGTRLFGSGGAGVDLFFVISGFIMMHTTRDVAGSPRAAVEFLAKRFARIWPVYAVAFAAMWLITRASDSPAFVTTWWSAGKALAFYPQAPHQAAPFFGYPLLHVGWTLNYEAFFYLVFAASLLAPRRWRPLVLAAIFAGCLIGLPLLAGDRLQWDAMTSYGFAGYAAVASSPIVWDFGLGVLIALVHRSRFAVRDRGLLGCFVALAAGAVAWQFLSGYRLGHGPTHWGLPMAVLVLALMLYDKAYPIAVPRWLTWLGDILVLALHVPRAPADVAAPHQASAPAHGRRRLLRGLHRHGGGAGVPGAPLARARRVRAPAAGADGAGPAPARGRPSWSIAPPTWWATIAGVSAESTDDDRPSGLEATEVPSGPDTLPGVGAPGASADGRGRTIRPPVSDELRPGDVIGRYLIERKVGVGGMGEVYAAHDPQLDRRVAIKVLRPSSRAADAATRLVREAQALAKLAHPNVVAVYEVGEAAGRVFFAMQFVEGTTLGEHLASQRPRWAEIVSMYVAAGRGLAAAHAAGLIHRDVKPGNVLVDRHGHVAVTDFGVARAADDFATPEPAGPAWTGPTTSATGRSALSTDMTQAGAVIGTPAFMAPEQHAGQRATARSDQFSFCLSIWLGVFGVHPFVPVGHGEVTSPFEYMALVGEGALVPPPRRPHLPRRVIAALSRGLARDPDARWPSMTALLEQLEPRSGYRAAVVALAAVATVGAGAAVWFAVHGRAAAGPSCATTVAERVGTAWGPSRAAALVKTFATTGRPYAEVTAQAAAVALDQYARRWSALATDACAGGAAGGDGERAVAVARAQCLDRGLGALRAVTGMLADTARGELVDNALQVVAGLPDLGDCADPATLSAAGVPPAAQAGAVAALEARLATAKALVDAGLLREADRELAAMVAEVDAVGWVPLRVRVRVTLGENRLASFEPATALVATAASLATAHHLDRDAARAWATMIQLAGLARQPDAVAAYTEIAGAAAAATADPALIARVRTYHGRALSRMRRFAAAEPECRAALTEARARADVAWRDLAMARDCLLEAVVPLGKYPEAMALAEEGIAARSAQIGAEHPAIADYLSVLVRVKRGIGQTDEARAALARVQVIRERAFGPHHLKSAETLEDLAWFEADPGERQALLERALAIAVDPINAGPRQPMIEGSIVRSLADAAGREHDHVAMRRHFDRALALAEQVAGPVSIDVAMLLLGDGQYTSEVDLDQALVKLRRSVEILDQLKDGRITMARAAVALILTRAGRHAEAVPVLERALAELDDTSTEPSDLALLRQSLAEAIVATHGDRTRARALATAALAGYRSLGAEAGDSTAYVEGWLRRHR